MKTGTPGPEEWATGHNGGKDVRGRDKVKVSRVTECELSERRGMPNSAERDESEVGIAWYPGVTQGGG